MTPRAAASGARGSHRHARSAVPPRAAGRLRALAGACALLATTGVAQDAARAADGDRAQWTGERIMREVQARHESFPYVYEEQTMVLTDAGGNRTVRQLRRFSRVDDDGSARLLLVFDAPEEIRGVALLARRDPDGSHHQGVYLPAFGPAFKRPGDDGRAGNFLGTDLAVADLTPDPPGDFRYVRVEDRTVEEVDYFVVEAYPADRAVERRTGYGLRRHMVRQDNLVVTRTDFFDRGLRFVKRLTRHDLKRVDGESWRANMIVVSDEREHHRTLLKIDRRVYSPDYVPAEIFEPAFLLANGHLQGLDDRVAGRVARERGDGS